MIPISRRNFLGLTAMGLSGLAVNRAWALEGGALGASAALQSLYKSFSDPDRRYSIHPFWFWNGKLEGAELRRQIKQMVDHGVYGAYVHNRDGLQTPYLSEAWWEAVGEALKAAREFGFSMCMVDEFEWPSGEARDYWLPGINKSRVVAANPDFHMHRLKPAEMVVQGPRRIRVPLPERLVTVVVARQTGCGTLDGGSVKALSWAPGAKEIEWEAPAGKWIVFTYGVERATGQPDNGHVDLMSREAIAKFIEIYYEEFYRRYGEYFGSTLPATFADHEGDYGAKLPWTPRLFETFQRNAGYALEPFLPALTYDIGSKTEKVRCDLLDAVSELYCASFFKQVTDWCRRHKLDHSGHVWEESLFFGPM
ncbi:MAG: glycosyl hydrolase, partial [Terriglobia bacterium]